MLQPTCSSLSRWKRSRSASPACITNCLVPRLLTAHCQSQPRAYKVTLRLVAACQENIAYLLQKVSLAGPTESLDKMKIIRLVTACRNSSECATPSQPGWNMRSFWVTTLTWPLLRPFGAQGTDTQGLSSACPVEAHTVTTPCHNCRHGIREPSQHDFWPQ